MIIFEFDIESDFVVVWWMCFEKKSTLSLSEHVKILTIDLINIRWCNPSLRDTVAFP